MQLLSTDREGAAGLGEALLEAVRDVRLCSRCRMLTESDLCSLCSSGKRKTDRICVVPDMSDLMALEQCGCFDGRYFVLHGLLSPVNSLGPEELGLPALAELVAQEKPAEIILTLDSSIESDATAHYIQMELADQKGMTLTRIARLGLRGGGLDQVDQQTLSQAFSNRAEF